MTNSQDASWTRNSKGEITGVKVDGKTRQVNTITISDRGGDPGKKK